MSARALLAAAVAVTFLPFSSEAVVPERAVPVAVPARADASVTVAHLMFMPGKVKVGLGEKVTWTFPELTSHTSTSDQGFWDSGTKTGGATYVRTFGSAGTFAYHCNFHATMRGSVSVGLQVTAPSNSKRIVRWATAKGAGNITYDVQLKIGSGRWKDFRTDTVRPKATFKATKMPDKPFKVRARTSKGAQNSGWSKPVRLVFP